MNVLVFKKNGLDNAIIEKFSGQLKNELLYFQKFESVEPFEAELIDYLNCYNNCSIKAKKKGLPPAINRQQALLAT